MNILLSMISSLLSTFIYNYIFCHSIFKTILNQVEGVDTIFYCYRVIENFLIVELRSRSGEGQVRVRKDKVRLDPAQRTQNSKIWT